MLKARLATLRRESGAKPPSSAANTSSPAEERPKPGDDVSHAPQSPHQTPNQAEKQPLKQRLQGHGLRTARQRRATPDDSDLASHFNAELVSPGLLCIDRQVPLQQQHGQHPLSIATQPITALPLAQLDSTPAPQGLLYFDTETTGLSGGVGTLAFMLGMARLGSQRGQQQLQLRQLMLTSLRGEPAMLALANEWAAQADACVSYNGLSFDLPLLAARYRLSGQADPFSPRDQIDLLHPTRRAFARPWGHCRLADVERRLLRFQRHDDLPGSEAPAAWLALLQRGDPSQLRGVLRHNHWDLLSLAALLPVLDRVYQQPGKHQADLGSIARHWQQQGQAQRARQLLEQHSGQLDARERLQLAWHYRQQGAWDKAQTIWAPLAERGNHAAIEAMAKYQEHQCRDDQAALDYALRLPPSAETQRRCARLSSRLQKQDNIKIGLARPVSSRKDRGTIPPPNASGGRRQY